MYTRILINTFVFFCHQRFDLIKTSLTKLGTLCLSGQRKMTNFEHELIRPCILNHGYIRNLKHIETSLHSLYFFCFKTIFTDREQYVKKVT